MRRPGSFVASSSFGSPKARIRSSSAPLRKPGPATESVDSLRREVALLETSLELATAVANQEELKRRIIAVFKATDAAIAELQATRDRIKGLVDRYKQIGAEDVTGPTLAAIRPETRADHLGASTYIEKGWSFIALGDHAAATQALTRALAPAPGDLHAQTLWGWA